MIFCCIAFHRCSQIFKANLHDTSHKTFLFLFWKNRLLCTCRKTLFHWIWRCDNHVRRLFLNFRLETYWWSHTLLNIRWMLETSFFHFFWVHLFLWKVKTFCNQTLWNKQSHFELIFSAIFAWTLMMSFNSMLTTTFDSICTQRRDNILSRDLSTISHAFWCILFFRLTTHQTFRFFLLFKNILRRSISINFLRAHSIFKLFIDEDFLINAYNTNYRTFIEFYSITLIN